MIVLASMFLATIPVYPVPPRDPPEIKNATGPMAPSTYTDPWETNPDWDYDTDEDIYVVYQGISER